MRGRVLILIAVAHLAFLSAWSRKVRAQEPEPETPRELYERGARAYNAGNFDLAIMAFERAYAISGKAALLFNIAQAERLAGPAHCERALEIYRRFLREEPNASNAAEVEQRIGEMKACSDAQRARAPAPVRGSPDEASQGARTRDPAKSTAPASTSPSRVGPLVSLGSGAAMAASGAVIYLFARAKFNEVASTCPCKEGEFAGWERATNVSYGLLALGGAAIVAGASWWLIDTRQQRSAGYAVGVVGGRVSLSGSF